MIARVVLGGDRLSLPHRVERGPQERGLGVERDDHLEPAEELAESSLGGRTTAGPPLPARRSGAWARPPRRRPPPRAKCSAAGGCPPPSRRSSRTARPSRRRAGRSPPCPASRSTRSGPPP